MRGLGPMFRRKRRRAIVSRNKAFRISIVVEMQDLEFQNPKQKETTSARGPIHVPNLKNGYGYRIAENF